MVNYFIKILPELNLGKLLHGHLHVHRWEVDLRMGEVTMIVSTREFLECSTVVSLASPSTADVPITMLST